MSFNKCEEFNKEMFVNYVTQILAYLFDSLFYSIMYYKILIGNEKSVLHGHPKAYPEEISSKKKTFKSHPQAIF